MLKRGIGLFEWVLLIFLVVPAVRQPAIAQQALLEVRQQDANQMVLKTASPANYRAFNLKNPDRIFIYVYESSLQAANRDIACSGKYIKYAKIYPFDGNYGTVRVEIGIADGMRSRDWVAGNEIRVWVGGPSDTPPEAASAAAHPATAEAAPTETAAEEPTTNLSPTGGQPAAGGGMMTLATRYMARPGSAPRAMKVLDIMVTPGDEATKLTINTDGPIRGFDDFALTGPNRLVLDIFDAKADFVQPQINVTSSAITAVRWGPHKDRARLVVDLAGSASAPYYQVKKTKSGLEVTVYSNKTADQAPASEFTKYTVAAGENLQAISKKVYGDSRAWRKIVSANPDKFPDTNTVLDSEGLLYPKAGMVLKLPVR